MSNDLPMSCYLTKEDRIADMSNNGWIKHDGKGYPGFPVGTKLLVEYRLGGREPKTIRKDHSGCENIVWSWSHFMAGPDEILAYKVVS